MIRLGLVGASGRTGAFVVDAVRENKALFLHAAIVSSRSALLGQRVPGCEVCYVDSLEALAGADVVVEFSTPAVSEQVAAVCVKHKIPLIVASTGHSPGQMDQIRAAGGEIPVCIAPNTSVGAAVLTTLVEQANRALGDSYDIELLDIHHRMKKDSPSGTARAVLEPVSRGKEVVFARHGMRQHGEVGAVSLRGGDVVGEHTVYFFGDGERIELSHKVGSRAVFGRGAVVLAQELVHKPLGVYSAKGLIESRLG